MGRVGRVGASEPSGARRDGLMCAICQRVMRQSTREPRPFTRSLIMLITRCTSRLVVSRATINNLPDAHSGSTHNRYSGIE